MRRTSRRVDDERPLTSTHYTRQEHPQSNKLLHKPLNIYRPLGAVPTGDT